MSRFDQSDHSIEHEPHLKQRSFKPDPGDAGPRSSPEERANSPLRGEDEQVEHGVWDEPGLSPELAGKVPEGELTYRHWLLLRRSATPISKTWLITFAVAACAGPLGVIAAFWGSGQNAFSIVAMICFAPAVEEMVKIMLPLYLVEKRPFLFCTPLQIALCAVCGGLAFATIENLHYLEVRIANPQPWLVAWRWTVCTALHTGCSLIASLGLIRVWRDLWRRTARPRLSLAFPFLVAAMITHGTYNALAIIFERFFG